MSGLLAVEEALARILARVPAPVGERVRLAGAAGRVLAAPVLAGHDQPPFDSSSMDGYAVRAGDIVAGHGLEILGVSQAGAGFAGTVGPGQCVRIFTGAPVPEGADAVIMQEEAEVSGAFVRFSSRPAPGNSIRPRGQDFRAGMELLGTGRRLDGFSIALAAAANQAELTVARQPRIALLATGDELVEPGTVLGPDMIVASNSLGLAPLFARHAESVADLGIAPDTREGLRARLGAALGGEADILVTSGGASVGDHDLVQAVLKEIGVTIDFWRIDMRPGKPLMFGTFGEKLVFGLPGNPVSALVTSFVFILPALRAWAGADPAPRRLRLPLAGPTPANSSRRHFMRARLVEAGGVSAALPVAETDSGHLSSLASADLLIVQPGFDPGQPAGSVVDAFPLFGD